MIACSSINCAEPTHISDILRNLDFHRVSKNVTQSLRKSKSKYSYASHLIPLVHYSCCSCNFRASIFRCPILASASNSPLSLSLSFEENAPMSPLPSRPPLAKSRTVQRIHYLQQLEWPLLSDDLTILRQLGITDSHCLHGDLFRLTARLLVTAKSKFLCRTDVLQRHFFLTLNFCRITLF